MKKLKAVLGQKVFVVTLANDVFRSSDYGKLEIVEDEGIVITTGAFGHSNIPFDNGRDRILKIYDKQGYVVYDAEKKKKASEK